VITTSTRSRGTSCALRGAAVVALLATLACDAPPAPAPAAPPRAQRARAEGDVCLPTGAHGAHGLFACQACHPCGGALSFDLPVRLPGGTTSAGGTIVRDAAGVTCSVGCHAPKGSPLSPVSWSTPGPLACTACHAPASLPNTHPPVLATATRADCLACHVLEQHTGGTVVVVGTTRPGRSRRARASTRTPRTPRSRAARAATARGSRAAPPPPAPPATTGRCPPASRAGA
jgi:hypothetical protein